MNSSLLSNLLAFYAEDPSDPFNVYALALEYQKWDQEKARSFFELLLTDFPDYLATYYSAGQFFLGNEEFERAQSVYETGIELAGKLGNQKTMMELQRALRSLQDEMEE
jgi:tetratricopeptide (TPR) repeat protein